MPELPEVHTTIEGLKKVIVGKTIKGVWSDFHIGAKYKNKPNIKNEKYFHKFKKIVVGSKIKGLTRKGKNILIHLENPKDQIFEYTIVVHMKMTGCLMYKKDNKEKYIHLAFTLSDKNYLLLSDLRKFASVVIVETAKLSSHEAIKGLGPDPLDPKFGAKDFFEILHRKKKTPIKSALHDQGAIAGIGNIYSDEILWSVGIHPFSRADKIPKNKFLAMFKATQNILRFSIKHGGDSKSDYRNAFGEKGGFQNFHKVYGKKKEKCPKRGCGGIIGRIVVRGRSAHFCPKHQVLYEGQ